MPDIVPKPKAEENKEALRSLIEMGGASVRRNGEVLGTATIMIQ